MKKRFHPVAIVLWVSAAFVTISEAIIEPWAHYQVNHASPALVTDAAGHLVSILWILGEIRSGLISGALLIGAGTLVELVDQIRWNALHRGH